MPTNTVTLGQHILEGFRRAQALSPAQQWGKALDAVFAELRKGGVEDVLTPLVRVSTTQTLADVPGIFLALPAVAPITLTLPASPSDGRRVIIKNIATAFSVTVDGNGHLIDSAATVVLDASARESISLVFDAVEGRWWNI